MVSNKKIVIGVVLAIAAIVALSLYMTRNRLPKNTAQPGGSGGIGIGRREDFAQVDYSDLFKNGNKPSQLEGFSDSQIAGFQDKKAARMAYPDPRALYPEPDVGTLRYGKDIRNPATWNFERTFCFRPRNMYLGAGNWLLGDLDVPRDKRGWFDTRLDQRFARKGAFTKFLDAEKQSGTVSYN